jgi:hypothetical protein
MFTQPPNYVSFKSTNSEEKNIQIKITNSMLINGINDANIANFYSEIKGYEAKFKDIKTTYLLKRDFFLNTVSGMKNNSLTLCKEISEIYTHLKESKFLKHDTSEYQYAFNQAAIVLLEATAQAFINEIKEKPSTITESPLASMIIQRRFEDGGAGISRENLFNLKS